MVFADLLILLTFVWFSRKLFQLIKFPPLFGEIFAGLLAGPLILGVVGETEAIMVLAELGIFFLMFHAGLEANPTDLFKSSKTALFVALGGIVFPFIGGFAVTSMYGYDFNTSMFVAMGLSITAVAISARLFKDSGINNTRVAHVTMTAAIIDDILTLILFAVVLDLAKTGNVDIEHVVFLVMKIVAYFAIVFYVGHKYFKYLYKIIYKGNKGFTFSLILALLFGVVAELVGIHMIIGAFLAGLFLRKEVLEEKVYKKIEDRVFGLSYSFLGPIFFATLAFHLDFSALWDLPMFVFLIFAVAVVGKVVGTGVPAYLCKMKFHEALGVGLAMNSRGAVELIVASIGLQAGIISQEIFSVLVLVAFGTTLISIVGIKPLVPAIKGQTRHLSLKEKLVKIVT